MNAGTDIVLIAGRVDYVDIDSGHWPMFTGPTELADCATC
jgi:hypothetical protein